MVCGKTLATSAFTNPGQIRLLMAKRLSPPPQCRRQKNVWATEYLSVGQQLQ